MRMTEMMSSEQFSTIKDDMPLEALPAKGGSVYDMTDSQKRMARMGQQIAAGLSPRSSDINSSRIIKSTKIKSRCYYG